MEVRRPRYAVAALAVAASLGLHAAVLSLLVRRTGPAVEVSGRAPVILSLAGASLAHLSEAEPSSEDIAGAGEVATAPPAPENPPASTVDPAEDPPASPVPEPQPTAAEPRQIPSPEPVPPVAAIEPVPMPPPSLPAESSETPATAEPAPPPGLAVAASPASPEPLSDPAPPDDLPAAGAPGLAPGASAPPPMRVAEAAPGEIGPARDVTSAPAPAAGAPPGAMDQTIGAVLTNEGEASPPLMPATADEPPVAAASVAGPAGTAPPPAPQAEIASAEVGPAREAPAVAAPAAIVPPEVPPPPVGAVGVPAAGVASLEAPAVSAERVRGFVDRYDGGPCFFAAVTRTTPTGADVETFSATVDQVMAFHEAFMGQIGVEPDVIGQRVWSAQCPAIEFLRRTRPTRARPLTVEIDRREIRGGDTLRGVVRHVGGSRVALFLVSELGVVTDLSAGLAPSGEDQLFAWTLRSSRREGPFPELIVAVVDPSNPGSEPSSLAGLVRGMLDASQSAPQGTAATLTAAGMLFLLNGR